jgi:hypothetical protein
MSDSVSNFQASDRSKYIPDLGQEQSNLAALRLLEDSTRPNLVINQATRDNTVQSITNSNGEIIISNPFSSWEDQERKRIRNLDSEGRSKIFDAAESYENELAGFYDHRDLRKPSQRLEAERDREFLERTAEKAWRRERILIQILEEERASERIRARRTVEPRQ